LNPWNNLYSTSWNNLATFTIATFTLKSVKIIEKKESYLYIEISKNNLKDRELLLH
jgi:hypothetical protein